MKKYQNLIIRSLILPFIMVLFGSCNKWFDVQPKTESESAVVFETEAGFKDALTGVYINMTKPELYGKDLSFGMVEAMSGVYKDPGASSEFHDATIYSYNTQAFASKSATVFSSAYNAIANLNNILGNIHSASPSVFTGANYRIIKGESYALRAMLHFDMIRLFGSAPASQGAKPAIPYVEVIGLNPKPRLTTNDFVLKVLSDLEIAATELKSSDPIISTNSGNATTYLRNRSSKMNYYAVKSLQARVYLYMGDKVKALAAAREVIESNVFQWTPSTQIATTSESDRNKVFTQELVFALNVSQMSTNVVSYYNPSTPSSFLRNNDTYFLNFMDASDYRFQYLLGTNISEKYSNKFRQPEGGSNGAYSNMMPLIRKSELYYIAAECSATSNSVQAVEYLNEVRQRRNISALALTLTEAQIETEIKLEYRREFISEGQVFFYYKRKNLPAIDGVNVVMNDDKYVLPLPEREITYGL